MTTKPITSLRTSDLEKYRVWQFATNNPVDETAVRPIKQLPVATLSGKLAGTRVLLANGERLWALIGNLDVNNAHMNEHFVTLSIERDGRWFHLARYHDPDYDERGPEGLAKFLGLTVDDVFPVLYDVRDYVKATRQYLLVASRKNRRFGSPALN